MNDTDVVVIKSFKHNGHLHRMWLENRRVPDHLLHPEHAAQNMVVTVNCRTKIVEAAGSEWFSRSPGVTFFIPGMWYNIVALIENGGVRYYCNVASPPYMYGNVITYIDYDLDLIVTPSGERILVDQDEYERHKQSYHYSSIVEKKVREGLKQLTERADKKRAPFDSEQVLAYYDWWRKEWGDEA
ncbi:DUF402 domain-containing protein [Gorillibacterium timonense]|uniref:DUF402 domain-containing protein n=1 Tax=Gorillibacterium timonense TaxID=1689269 RepID=UPI00071CBF2C|nr:DUF402 domain-containing protein [Gorillibacterium timonense]